MLSPLEWAGAIVVAATAGGVLLRAERRGRRVANRILGDGPGRPGALDRLDSVEASVAAIQAQLSPDSGRSLHDVVVRVDERTLRIERQLGHVERRLDEHIAAPHPRR